MKQENKVAGNPENHEINSLIWAGYPGNSVETRFNEIGLLCFIVKKSPLLMKSGGRVG
jgi:hypothetical protein